MPNRIGGMDYFFWAFQKACDDKGIVVDWFFPNSPTISKYANLNIIASNTKIETQFLTHMQQTKVVYSHIITHFLELCTPFYKTLKKQTTAKIIAVDHNPRPLEGYPLKKQFKKRLKGWLYGNSIDLFVGVSKYTSSEIIKDFGAHLTPKVITIYNGVMLKDIVYRDTMSYDIPKFLVVSHLRKSKGIQDLIEAVALLPKELRASIKIDIYGKGSYKEILDELIVHKSLQKVFTFKGSVDILHKLYCRYDYLLQPTHMECFSLSILESLAANVPVVTTNVGGNEEVVIHNENGYIFKAKNIQVLSQILKNIINHSKKILTPTRNLVIEEFSIDAMVANHLKLITS